MGGAAGAAELGAVVGAAGVEVVVGVAVVGADGAAVPELPAACVDASTGASGAAGVGMLAPCVVAVASITTTRSPCWCPCVVTSIPGSRSAGVEVRVSMVSTPVDGRCPMTV